MFSMNSKVVSILLLILFNLMFCENDATTCSCGGPPKRSSRIVNGLPAGRHSMPYQVGLTTAPDGTEPFCGGVLISPYYVLTAAHCTKDYPASYFRVVVGEHDYAVTGDGEHYFLVSKVINHPKYQEDNVDMAILELEEGAWESDTTGYACLPLNPYESFVGAQLTVGGWGYTDEEKNYKTVLQTTHLFALANGICQATFPKEKITKVHICADNEGTDTCQGDSGGPLTINIDGKTTVVGVVAWGYGCAKDEYPKVFARVTTQLDWIYENTDARDCQPKQECGTTDGKTCVFPFKHEGVTYTGCTPTSSNKRWCATKTDSDGNYLDGYWGYCESVCPSAECKVKKGEEYGKPCKFPFVYKGSKYTKCIDDDGKSSLWCATETDDNSEYTKWGYCGSGCSNIL